MRFAQFGATVAYAAAAQMAAELRRRNHRIGPGTKNPMRGYGRYDGAALREARARNGVGRPPHVLAARLAPPMIEPV